MTFLGISAGGTSGDDNYARGQTVVKSATTSPPPGSPGVGDIYLMPPGTLTGAWSGYTAGDGAIYLDTSVWDFFLLDPGQYYVAEDSGAVYIRTAAGTTIPLYVSGIRGVPIGGNRHGRFSRRCSAGRHYAGRLRSLSSSILKEATSRPRYKPICRQATTSIFAASFATTASVRLLFPTFGPENRRVAGPHAPMEIRQCPGHRSLWI